ncbi:MAG: UbiD family decarboxylase [Anaerolineae bacterium]|nr:UbiD family decarboxylase [Anaerolineae bacterium]
MENIFDLRSYIEVLRKKGKLVEVEKPVALKHELAQVAAAIIRQGYGAAFFSQPGESNIPVFTGGVATPELASLALNCEPKQITEVLGRAIDPANGIAPKPSETAGWKKNVFTGKDVDLYSLPIPIHATHDGGPFITGAVTVTKDPVSGRGNLSYNRMQVFDKDKMGFNMNIWRHTMQFYTGQEALGKPLQVAAAIGLDPAITIAAGARYDDDELRIAGAIRGKSIPVTKGVTVDINIPSDAEIVIEGYLEPNERHPEGPLAEFHGYYGELWEMPVFHVTAICYRDNPIFQTMIPGFYEHIYIGNVLPREPLLTRFARHVSQQVLDVHIPPYGCGFSAYVQLEKGNPGEPKNVALATLTAHVNVKTVIVVDPDVDIYDPADILWAINTRVDWTRDIFLVPGAMGHEMDPTGDAQGIHAKVGIDATYKPERRAYGERVRYPNIDLSQYIKTGR